MSQKSIHYLLNMIYSTIVIKSFDSTYISDHSKQVDVRPI